MVHVHWLIERDFGCVINQWHQLDLVSVLLYISVIPIWYILDILAKNHSIWLYSWHSCKKIFSCFEFNSCIVLHPKSDWLWHPSENDTPEAWKFASIYSKNRKSDSTSWNFKCRGTRSISKLLQRNNYWSTIHTSKRLDESALDTIYSLKASGFLWLWTRSGQLTSNTHPVIKWKKITQRSRNTLRCTL